MTSLWEHVRFAGTLLFSNPFSQVSGFSCSITDKTYQIRGKGLTNIQEEKELLEHPLLERAFASP